MDAQVAPPDSSEILPLPDDAGLMELIAECEPPEVPEWRYQLRITDARGVRVVPLERRVYRIGRAPENDLVLEDPGAPEHALRSWVGKVGLWYAPVEAGAPGGSIAGMTTLSVGEMLQLGTTVLQVEYLEEDAPPEGDFRGMVGRTPPMLALYERIRLAAPSSLTVLIRGETGTGKEAVARALHDLSPRAGRPYVVVNCSGFTASLVESELFGTEKGAFTGALQAKEGLFETADGGTLFLDEIGELPLELQPKLLRALQTGDIRRVGGAETRHVDVRVLAATHVNLEEEVAQKRFRADLFFRLNVLSVNVPALVERTGDVVRLARHFLGRAAAAETVTLSDEAISVLGSRSFPGNVRELENAIGRGLTLRGGAPVIEVEHLGLGETADGGAASKAAMTPPDADDPCWIYLPGKTSAEVSREATAKAHCRHNGNARAAAQELDVHRNTIRKRQD